MADTFGELQTLIATLQNLNVQLGNIIKAMNSSTSAITTAVAQAAPGPTEALHGTPGTPNGSVALTLPNGTPVYVLYYNARP